MLTSGQPVFEKFPFLHNDTDMASLALQQAQVFQRVAIDHQ